MSQRLQLDPSKHYNIVTYSSMTARDVTYMGQFVRSYTKEGAYIFWEFLRDGKVHTMSDHMHGYRDADLIVFEEVATTSPR
jgi:hypothetical protein